MKSKNLMSDVRLTVKDNNGREWFYLTGFLGDKREFGDRQHYISIDVGINSAFVRKRDCIEFEKWAKNEFFYGRWMPEFVSGEYEFLWNEYPWSDSYKKQGYKRWETPRNNCPVEIMLAHRAQLQEDLKGLYERIDFLGTAYAPCEEMMETLKLYTAERGIVRKIQNDNNDNIVSFNRNPIIDNKHEGMYIRKSDLLEFMRQNQYTLFTYIWGEKQYADGSPYQYAELSCCYKLTTDGNLSIIQNMRSRCNCSK